jgi:predicted permease
MSSEWLTEAWLKMKTLLHRGRFERDLDEELQFHLEMLAEKNRTAGLRGKEAHTAARRRFGNVTVVKEDCHEMWTFTWIETVWQDLRYAARTLAKSPGYVAVVIGSLALGIGANTAVFSVMSAVLFHSLPYEHSERLTTIWPTHKEQDLPPLAEITDWKKQNDVFDDIAAISGAYKTTMTGVGDPGPILVQRATENFFAVIRVHAALGRVFRAEESQEQFQTVVISNTFWKNKFDSDPDVLGKTFRLNGVVSTVVGVMPAGFEALGPWYEGKSVDVWEPVNPESPKYAKRMDEIMPVARLKPGVTLSQAQVEMDVIARGLEQAYPETNKGVGEKVLPLYDTLYGRAGELLYPLLLAVGFVLLIGCINVANLMQSRTETRRREYSLRASLGAGRGRLSQQLLVEGGLLTVLGGSLGVLVSFWATHILRVIATDTALPHAESIHINGRVLLFAVCLSVVTALLFGLAPALRAARADLNDVLREGESWTSTSRRGRTLYLLVISEVAMAMVLLVGAGLMINSLLSVTLPSPGFEPTNVLTMAVNFPGSQGNTWRKFRAKTW